MIHAVPNFKDKTNNIETNLTREWLSMGTFFVVTCVLICTSLLLKKMNQNKRTDFFQWGLGVDCCCYYSLPFSISNNCITIIGFQEILDKNKTIRYSVVKLNWWGKRTVYGQRQISGSYKNPQGFQVSIHNLPNGENFQIEVFNDFTLSCGQFKLKG